jgi:UTP--glucose-1-phosphate uridylyltransferase
MGQKKVKTEVTSGTKIKTKNSQITKAVVLAGGLGTRMYPVTKCIAKEMFPILCKPAMQYIADELVNSGIKEIIVIINPNKGEVKEYFVKNPIENKKIKLRFVMQEKPTGSAIAVQLAQEYIKKGEAFVIVNGDDLMHTDEGTLPVTKQLMDCYDKYHKSVIGGQIIPKSEVVKYGMMTGDKWEGRSLELTDIIEKPAYEDVTSQLVALGRYIATYDIFDRITHIGLFKGEYYVTDAFRSLAKDGQAIGYDFVGKRYDLGKIEGFIFANLDFAMRDEQYSATVKDLLADYYN